MNIRNTTFSLLVAASLGVAFTQNANARDDYQDNMNTGDGMRIHYAPNIIRGHGAGRAAAQLNFGPQPSAMPKDMLGITPDFVKKTPPPPIAKAMPAMPIPTVQAQVVQKPSVIPDALKSIFGNPAPQTPLIAQGAQPLPTAAAAKPATAPAHGHSANVAGKVLRPSHARPQVASGARPLPPVASYGSGYTPIPHTASGGSDNASRVVDSSVLGRIIRH